MVRLYRYIGVAVALMVPEEVADPEIMLPVTMALPDDVPE
jgi:hypothetical protein